MASRCLTHEEAVMVVRDVVDALRKRYGESWARDEEANLRFSADVEHVLQDVDGAHLIGEPDLDEDEVKLTVWVDVPLRDLMSADQLAYDIFGRLSEEIFYAERRFAPKVVHYDFVTGSASHGHVGALILAGPHAADFADRHHVRMTGGSGFQA